MGASVPDILVSRLTFARQLLIYRDFRKESTRLVATITLSLSIVRLTHSMKLGAASTAHSMHASRSSGAR